MKHFVLLAALVVLPSTGWAACPAAPVGSNQDRVIQMVAGVDGQAQMAREEITDATEEGAIVYDNTLKTLVVCDGTNWVALSGSGSLRGDCGVTSRLEWDGTEWQCTVGLDACLGTPAPGAVCADGTVYAGISPDGIVPMYTTPIDAPSTMSWNNGAQTWTDTPVVNCTGTQTSCRTGEANTTILAGLSDAASPHVAARYCNNLTAHGFTDWYLPAQEELSELYDNRTAIGNFTTNLYWSSSEANGTNDNFARRISFADGTIGTPRKHFAYQVRCVRK